MAKIHRDSEEPGNCPSCGKPHTGNIGYSFPATAMCECGEQWSFGSREIKVLTLEEHRRVAPGLYKDET